MHSHSNILEALPSETWYQEVRVEINFESVHEGRFGGYYLVLETFLQHHGHIYVPILGDLHFLVMFEARYAPYPIDPGIKTMHAYVRHLYHWERMRHDVVNFVSICLKC